MMDYSREELIEQIKAYGFERTLRDQFAMNTGPIATPSDNEIMIEVLMEYLIMLEQACQDQAHKLQALENKICQ